MASWHHNLRNMQLWSIDCNKDRVGEAAGRRNLQTLPNKAACTQARKPPLYASDTWNWPSSIW